MKAVFLVALVAVVLSLAQSSTACTAINRRNTVWVGLPGPGTSATNPLLVRVYRTDKFNYNIDGVDATVNMNTGALTKVKSTSKSRTTPAGDDLSIYSLANTTSIMGDTRPAWSLLQKLKPGVFEIMFRAYYEDFPLDVDIKTDKLYWISNATNVLNFYFGKPSGEMVIVQDIANERRDFNLSSSTFSTFDFSGLLRSNTTNSTESVEVGSHGIARYDAAKVVVFPYGSSTACNDGYAFLNYSDVTQLTALADLPENTIYYFDSPNAKITYVTSNNTLVTEVISAGGSSTSLKFTDAQLNKIISRVKLGAWLGPLLTLAILWIGITLFCATCNRSRC